MKEIRTILADLRRADTTFSLIQQGDKIVVGISGGKDSLVLFYALHLYTKFAQKSFTIIPVILDLGFPGFNPLALQQYFQTLGYELIVSDAQTVYSILAIQQQRQALTHLPCSICSRMKKAAINKVALALGANKVAFAHHADDAIETLFLNQIHGGRMATFAPKMHLENAGIDFIRPLILASEASIRKCAHELALPVMASPCPADKHTTRETIKHLLSEIYHTFPMARANFLTMLTNGEQADLWFDELEYPTSVAGLTIKPVYSKEDKSAVLYIRMKVFVEEQKVPLEEEITADENTATYFLLLLNGQPIGTIRYFGAGNDYHIGRFAILKEYRGCGYGTILFTFVEKYLSDRIDPLTISLGGQSYLSDYYQHRGYTPFGEEYIDAGIKHYHFIKHFDKQKSTH